MPSILQAVVLGLVQGLTEFLPVSSTAHLTLVPWLFGWESALLNSLTFDVALHMGTLIAVLAYFRRDWIDLVRGGLLIIERRDLSDRRSALAAYVVIGTIPAVIAGVLLERLVDSAFRSPMQIALMLALFSAVMFAAERLGGTRRGIDSLGLVGAFLIGVGQAIAIVPGVSRSGATISTGLLLGLERAAAARFSFLLSTPIVAAAGAKKLLDVRQMTLGPDDVTLMVVGALTAGISGWLCIRWLLRFLSHFSMDAFVAYRLLLAAIVLTLYLVRGG